jgi:hypothetical protein
MITARNARSERRRRSSSEGKRSRPQLGDLHLDATGSGRHRFRAVPVAVGTAVLRALVAARANGRGGFGLDQRLQSGAHQLGEHRAGIALGESLDR